MQRINAHKERSQIKIVRKRKVKRTSSLLFCDGKYNSKNNETSKDTKKKEKRMDVNEKLKRSKAVGVMWYRHV